MSTRPTATRPYVAPSLMPKISGRARTSSAKSPISSEARLVLELGHVLARALRAVGLEDVGRRAAEARCGVVDRREDVGREALALQPGKEALPREILAAGDQLLSEQLLGAPQAVSDVVTGLAGVGGCIGLLVIGVGLVEALVRREEVSAALEG